MLGLGRPGSRLLGTMPVDSFSQSSGNSQLLRPLSVTPSILDSAESPWPLLVSTPSPAWSGSTTNTLCPDDVAQQISSIPPSSQLSNCTRIPTSLIPTMSNSSMSSSVINNRPIGADVLLSSSSSVASQIQEQMSHSLRQKNLMGPQVSLCERVTPITVSSTSIDHPNASLNVSLPLSFSSTEPISTNHSASPFKPHGQKVSIKSALVQTPVQVTVPRESILREAHHNLQISSSSNSDIKSVPLQPTCTLKLVGGDSLSSNQFLQPISHLGREHDMLKEVNDTNKRIKQNFSIPATLNTIPRTQNSLTSSLELPLLPVGVVSCANYNPPNNPSLLGPLRLASNPSVSFSVSTPSTGMLNVVRTVPVVPETGLTLFPSVNTPKMSLITLDNSDKVVSQNEISQCHTRPPLRRILRESTSEPLVVGSISNCPPFQGQMSNQKMQPFENVEIVSGPTLSSEQNVRVLLPENLSYMNTHQNASNVKFVPCVDGLREKQAMPSSTEDGNIKLWSIGSSNGIIGYENDKDIITTQRQDAASMLSSGAIVRQQRMEKANKESISDMKMLNLHGNFSSPINVPPNGSSASSITSILGQITKERITQQCETSNRSMVQPMGQVDILQPVAGNIQSGVIEATLLNPQKMTYNTKQIIKNQDSIPITIMPQHLSNLNKKTSVIGVVDHIEPHNLVQIAPLASSSKSNNSVPYIKCVEQSERVAQQHNAFPYIASSMSTITDPKSKYVQPKSNSVVNQHLQNKGGQENNILHGIDFSKKDRSSDIDNIRRQIKTERTSGQMVFTDLLKKTKNSKDNFPDVLTADEYSGNSDIIQKYGTEEPNNTYIEKVVCCKCRICGYLTTSFKRINDHLEREHLDLLEASVLSYISPNMQPILTNWGIIAQKHKIPLRCPLCINTFQGTHLSFKVHLMDDHALNEDDTNAYFETQNEKRRTETFEDVKKRRCDIEKQKRNKQEILEAYVDEKGELRVRTAKRYIGNDLDADERIDKTVDGSLNENLNNAEGHVDVSAKEYIDVVKIANSIGVANTNKHQNYETINPSEKQKRLLDLTKSSVDASLKSYPRKVKKKVNAEAILKTVQGNSMQKIDRDADTEFITMKNDSYDKETMQTKGIESLQSRATGKVKRNVGRPKGSRSIGLTKLKRLNPQIQMHDKEMGGTECGVAGCAVRLKDKNKLVYHRKCHKIADNKTSAAFQCQECQPEKSSGIQSNDSPLEIYSSESWKRLALHLWRVHKIDMELYSCDICNEFKEFTLWRLEAHKIAHQVTRPFLCNECGKCFKTHRNLKMHSQLHQEKKMTPTSSLKAKDKKDANSNKGGVCSTCNKGFTTTRFLRHHIETVHKGLKPFMCNFCG